MNNLCNIKNNNIHNLNDLYKNLSKKARGLEKFQNLFKTTKIGKIKIKNKELIIKKEFLKENFIFINFLYKIFNLNVNEYDFYKKYTNKINKYHFQNNIQLPIKYKICNKKYSIYVFNKIETDLNHKFISKLNYADFNNVLLQIVYIMFFVNHILKVFHNDVSQINRLRNFMVNKNKKPYYLKINDEHKIKINNYRVILIDFGLFHKEIGFKTKLFYRKMEIKYIYFFQIYSELLLCIYLLFNNYNKTTKINFKKLYLYFFDKIKIKNLYHFDKCILDNILDLDSKLLY